MVYTYETICIIRSDLGDEATEEVITKLKSLLEENGAQIQDCQRWGGKRRLAYEIDRHRDGVYVQVNYTGSPTLVAQLERSMRLSEAVIRYLTVKQPGPAQVPQT